MSTTKLEASFIIEALRAGIPTRKSTRLLPDLRHEISEKVMRDLDEFDGGQYPAGRILWGQYGQGKTHALTALEHMALDRNFAVSRVTLSREVSCHDLMAFYAEAAAKIRTPNSTLNGISRLLSGMRGKLAAQTTLFEENRYTHHLPALVLEAYLAAEGEMKEKLLADLTGSRLPASEFRSIYRQVRGVRLPALRFRAAEHAGAYFSFMADLLHLAGCEGWVILIDEAELIGRLGRISRCKAYQNLIWLLNWQQQKADRPLYTIAAMATRLQDDLWYGRANDDRETMPQLAHDRAAEGQGSQAEKEMREFFSRAIDRRSLTVQPAKTADIIELLEAVSGMHGDAYAWQANLDAGRLVTHIGAQPVRTYIRAALESLDMEYQYGIQDIPELTQLDEMSLTENEEDLLPSASDEENA